MMAVTLRWLVGGVGAGHSGSKGTWCVLAYVSRFVCDGDGVDGGGGGYGVGGGRSRFGRDMAALRCGEPVKVC
jgi:hypothetical protein